MRVVTVDMITFPMTMYVCKACGRRSMSLYKGCVGAQEYYVDYPDKEKVLFVDEDMRIHVPPKTSCVWSRLFRQQPSLGDGSLQEPAPGSEEQEQEPLQTEPTPPPVQRVHPPESPPSEVQPS